MAPATIYSDASGFYWWNGDQCNVLTYGDYTFIIYADASKVVKVIRVSMPELTASSPVTVSTITDYHETPSLLVINDKLVAFKGSYGSDTYKYAQYAESSGDYDSASWGSFGSWTNLPLPATGTMGYVYPMLTSSGTVIIVALERSGNSFVAPSDCFYYRKTSAQTWAQGTWTKLLSAPPLSPVGTIAGANYGNTAIYLSRPQVETVGSAERIAVMFHLFWPRSGIDYAETSTAYQNVGYVYSENDGVTWRTADGSAKTLPIATNTDASPLFARVGYGWPYGWVTHDSSGNPVLAADTFSITSTGSRVKAYYGTSILRWNGSAWAETVIDSPTAGAAGPGAVLQSPKIAYTDKYRMFSFRDDGTATEPHQKMRVDESDDLATWTASGALFDASEDYTNVDFRITTYGGNVYVWRTYADPNASAVGMMGDSLQVELVYALTATPDVDSIALTWSGTPPFAIARRETDFIFDPTIFDPAIFGGGSWTALATGYTEYTYDDTSVDGGLTYEYSITDSTGAVQYVLPTASLGVLTYPDADSIALSWTGTGPFRIERRVVA